jgi:hypothetical protein
VSLHAAIWRILADELVEEVVSDGFHLGVVGHAPGHLLVIDQCWEPILGSAPD